MVSNRIKDRFLTEKRMMDEVFNKINIAIDDIGSQQFLEMARNYYKDSSYFFDKKDYIRAFEAIVISWAYVDAGIKIGFFSLPESLRNYFTS
jgi:hypothetical protein